MAYDMKYGKVTVDGDLDKLTPEEAEIVDERVRKFNSSDEPVFILRAQDALSVPALARYHVLAVESGLPQAFTDGLNGVIDTFVEWQNERPDSVSMPD